MNFYLRKWLDSQTYLRTKNSDSNSAKFVSMVKSNGLTMRNGYVKHLNSALSSTFIHEIFMMKIIFLDKQINFLTFWFRLAWRKLDRAKSSIKKYFAVACSMAKALWWKIEEDLPKISKKNQSDGDRRRKVMKIWRR